MTLPDRFIAKLDVGDCWVWTGADSKGYGQYHVGRRKVKAHRFAYEQLVAPIPDGFEIDHLCRNTRCVNPDHMEPVTNAENTLRGESLAAKAARRDHCVHGHPYDEGNTYFEPIGYRKCRICKRATNARYKARIKAAKAGAQ